MSTPRSERLALVVEFLRGRREPVTVDVLARCFGVTRRTLFSDISTLRFRGIEINGAPARGGGLTLVDSSPAVDVQSIPLRKPQAHAFVGREREMAELTAVLDGALDGRGGLVMS